MENLLLKQLEQKNLSSPWQPDSTATNHISLPGHPPVGKPDTSALPSTRG